jgi:hypothetical protein
MKRNIKKKKKKKSSKARRKPIDYDYQNINKKKLVRISNVISVIQITF